MLLTKKSGGAQGAARSPFLHSLQRGLSHALPTMDRRAFLRRSGLGVGVGIAASPLTLVKKAQAADGKAPAIGQGKIEVKRTVCTPLLGGLRDRRGGRERRLGAPGAGVRLADQPGRALRQGRGDARARPRRVPPALPDEAGQRQVRAHQLGHGAERDQRQDAGAAQGQRPRFACTWSARPSTTTSSRTCCASSSASGAATTATTRPASATPPRWPASPTPGATAP